MSGEYIMDTQDPYNFNTEEEYLEHLEYAETSRGENLEFWAEVRAEQKAVNNAWLQWLYA